MRASSACGAAARRRWGGVRSISEARLPVARRPSLTAKAKKRVAATQTASTTLDGCVKKGMPSIMMTPTPMEFVDKGDIINVRVEFNDTVRTIHMRASANNVPQARTPLGYSTGRWDGKTLVVETTQVDWPWFNFGIPQSAACVSSSASRRAPTAVDWSTR